MAQQGGEVRGWPLMEHRTPSWSAPALWPKQTPRAAAAAATPE